MQQLRLWDIVSIHSFDIVILAETAKLAVSERLTS